jgi:GrpB-like predicted nucleotidyltransferase (UPF0157 family)/GNAT superfamily N-acetyltransferase
VLADFDAERTGELVRMWRDSFEAGVGVTDPHPIAEQLQYFVDQVLPRHAIRQALVGDELAGFVAASSESVSQLYVHVRFQRRGIGTMLLDWAKRQSCGSLWLYTFARNSGARSFYEHHGFVAVAEGFEPTWQLDDVRYQWCAASPAVGLAAGTVRLAPYDPRWGALFEAEASMLRRALPGCSVAHIGSTAVPGLEAKPVIDVMLGMPPLRTLAVLHDALCGLGYVHRPDDTLRGRLFFTKSSGRLRTCNLSVCETNSPFWDAHVRFRDRLRSDPELARSYGNLKRMLASRHPGDRIAYTDGKDDFVAAALEDRAFRARAGDREGRR